MRVIRIGLDVLIFVVVSPVQEISEALARAELAPLAIPATGAAAAETILGGIHTSAEYHLVNELEVARQNSIVDGVDDGDGRGLVGCERPKLAPMTVVLLYVKALDTQLG